MIYNDPHYSKIYNAFRILKEAVATGSKSAIWSIIKDASKRRWNIKVAVAEDATNIK